MSFGAGGRGAGSTPACPPPGRRLEGGQRRRESGAGSARTAGREGGCVSSTSCRGLAGASISRPAFTARRQLHDPDVQVPPAPLLSCLLFSFPFCCWRQRAPDGKSLLSCAGNTRFLPPLPGTAPGVAQAAAPPAPCPCCPASRSPYGGSGGGLEGLVRGHGKDRPLSQWDTSGCSA